MPYTSSTYLLINLRSSLTRRTFLTRALLLVLFATMAGHFSVTPGQGWTPNIQFNKKSADLGDRGSLRINPSTLALEMEIPLGSYPGRAGLDVPVTISYSSKAWRVDFINYDPGLFSSNGTPIGNGYTRVVARFAEHSAAGWTSSIGFPVLDTTLLSEYYDGSGNPKSTGGCVGSPNATGTAALCYVVDRILVRMPDGSSHELRSSDQPQANGAGTAPDLYAVDGSRMRYHRPSQTLFMPDGSRYLFAASDYVDRNGNRLHYAGTGWTDTLGRTIGEPPVAYNITPGSYPYSLPGVSGQYVFVWKSLGDPGVLTTAQPLKYVADSGCPMGNGSYSPRLFQSDIPGSTCITNASSVFNPVVLHQIQLPTGRSYTFTYNEYGEIDRVELPAGGYERYEHAQVPTLGSPKLPYSQANRGVTHRYVSTGGGAGEAAWHYSPTTGKVGITAPDDTLTERFMHTEFSGICAWGYCPDTARAGMVYEERAYSAPENGARRLLRRTLTEWAMTGSNGSMAPAATRNPRATKSVELLLDTGGDALAKTTEYGYDLSNQFTTGPNQTSVSEYDYVPVAQSTAQTAAIGSIPRAAQPLLTTETAFLDDDPAYRLQNILGLPTLVTVRNGSGVVVSKTAMGYDESAYQLGNLYGAVTGWSAPTGPRANLTTVRNYLDVNSSVAIGQNCPAGVCVDTHDQYDQCGSSVKDIDALGNETLIVYSPLYDYAYPTSVTTPAPNPDSVPNPSGGPAFGPGTFGSTTGLASFTAYDHDTGRVTSTTDVNGKTTAFDYNDPLGRLKRVDRPDGGRTTYAYTDQHQCGAYVETRTLLDAGGRELASWQFYDGLGRPYLSATYENQETPNIFIGVVMRYDALGRVSKVSNPYRTPGCTAQANPSGLWTETAYDALGRVTAVTTPDGAKVYTLYDGARTLVTDQAGKERISKVDALGRLTDVWEVRPPDSATGTEAVSFPIPPNLASAIPPVSAGYRTVYAYDALSNLRTVTQGAQPARTFGYDSLSRLTSAANPESGTVGYTYDANGNLETKADARGVTTTYRYDRLNRNIIINYAGGGTSTPQVRRYYDNASGGANGLGRLYVTEAMGVAYTAYDVYDSMGRPKQYRQVFGVGSAWGQSFTVGRTYDKAGNVLTQTYPSGHAVTYNYDAAGRPADFNGQPAFAGDLGDGVARTYASALSYSEFGGIRQERFGTQTPLYRKLHYNRRGQLYDIRLSTQSLQAAEWDWNRGAILNYYGSNHSWEGDPSTPASPDNNGNLHRSEVYAPLDAAANYNGVAAPGAYYMARQTYAYDALNRLTSVTEEHAETQTNAPAAPFTQVYTYDRWGNRTVNLGQSANAPVAQYDFERGDLQSTNRLYAPGDLQLAVGQRRMRYDAAGNLTHDSYTGAGGRVYDAENRMTAAVDRNGIWASYTYDADGRRVKRNLGAGGEVWQVYGAGRELLAEYAPGASPTQPRKEYGYRGGQLLVTAEPSAPAASAKITPVWVTASGSYAQYAAANAADGNPATEWNSGGFPPQWVQLDLGQAYDLTKVRLEVSQSPSGRTVHQVYGGATPGQMTLLHTFDQVTQSGQWLELTTAAAGVRYLKVLTTVSPSWVGWVEVEAYGAPSVEKLSPAAVTASATYLSYVASNAADGSAATQWLADGFPTQWVQLDLGQAHSVSKVRLLVSQSPAGNTSHEVWCGPTPGQLTLVGTVSQYTQGGQWLEVDVAAAGARYVRVVTTAGPSWVGWLEVEAYGKTGADVRWLVSDQLGTPRMVLDQTGSLAGVSRHDFFPFGEEIGAGLGGRTTAQGYSQFDGNRKKWAQLERDNETGLDYAQARYYSSAMGRFTSPDEFAGGPDELYEFVDDAADNPTFYADLANPQSLNKYQYTYNNPLRYTDPDGHCPLGSTAVCAEAAAAVGSLAGPVGAVTAFLVYVAFDQTVGWDKVKPSGVSLDDCRACRDNGRFGVYSVDGKSQAQGDKPKEVTVDGNKHPEAARHIEDAQKAGKPDTLTVDRGGANKRRRESLRGTPRRQGKDRDEYPPAVTREGGKGASVRHINPKDNRGAGSSVGRQLRGVPDGTKVKIKVIPKKEA